MLALLDVLENYAATRTALKGKAVKPQPETYPDHRALIDSLPEFFQSVLSKLGRFNDFKVQGSYGAGVIAAVPWVGVFNRTVTESAQSGFYIVLLFSEDMHGCALSLNQGVTAFEKEYSGKVARVKIKGAASRALEYVSPSASAVVGPIALGATGRLGQGYERGAVISYCYQRDALPSAAALEADFVSLLDAYDRLVSLGFRSLESLAPVSELQYQQAVLEQSAASGLAELASDDSVELPAPIPAKVGLTKARAFQRNPAIAAQALSRAEHQCELDCEHKTFTSSARGLPYMEVHHLIPLAQQDRFPVSLDVVSNIVCLCPNCHRLLHHGKFQEKRPHLTKLHHARAGRLNAQGIEVTETALLELYRADLLEDE